MHIISLLSEGASSQLLRSSITDDVQYNICKRHSCKTQLILTEEIIQHIKLLMDFVKHLDKVLRKYQLLKLDFYDGMN